MRRFALATLVLAAALLFPVELSARFHPTNMNPPARRRIDPSVRSGRVQHPQPASFRIAAGESARRHKERAGERSSRQGSNHKKAPGQRTRRATRHDFRSAAAHIQAHRGSRSAQRTSDREPPTLAGLDTPSQPMPVVSVIRPTSDRPQLPSIQQAATEPIILPTLYTDRGRLVMPAALVGSHEILVRQNEMADQEGLGRVQDDADLDGMRQKRMLVALPASEALRIDDRLPGNRRYCRPWTAQFLATMARAHFDRFHTPLQVNSAVRTVAFQLRLQRTNGNAAPAEGDTASPHLTGQAVDIAKRGLSLAEIAWLRGYLLPLIQEGRADVEEEFQQSCFHISIYRRYLPPETQPQHLAASSRGTPALAVALP